MFKGIVCLGVSGVRLAGFVGGREHVVVSMVGPGLLLIQPSCESGVLC